MAHIKSEIMFEFLLKVKKRPYMYLNNKKCMSGLSDLELGFLSGYHSCCVENKCSIEADDLLWNTFLESFCKKYEINSPWYNELIEKCGSDERAYDVFMDELELFLKTNDIEIVVT